MRLPVYSSLGSTERLCRLRVLRVELGLSMLTTFKHRACAPCAAASKCSCLKPSIPAGQCAHNWALSRSL